MILISSLIINNFIYKYNFRIHNFFRRIGHTGKVAKNGYVPTQKETTMVNSVNTNSGAIVALQSLNRTNIELNSVQKRVSTGYRVSDAADDGAAFAVAQGLRSAVKGYESVNERLGSAKGLLSVSQEALRGISDTLGEARKVIVKLADASLSTSERTQYGNDYTALKAEVTNFVAQASFNGANLLSSGTAVNIIFNSTGGSFTLAGQNTQGSIAGAFGTLTSAADAAAVLTATGALSNFEGAVGTSLATVGGYIRSVNNQQNFISVLADATSEGIGAIVDADLAKESARLQSLQIRQQLGTQALSIANQAPSTLLSLFR
jgi:flagellin